MRLKILWIVLIFCLIITICAQNDESPVVEYHICRGVSDRNFLKADLETYLEKTRAILESQNVEITFASDEIFTCKFSFPNPLATVRYYEETDGNGIIDTREIRVWLSGNNLHEVTPILGNDLPLTISIWEENAPELFATFLLYSVGEIDRAKEKLLDLREKSTDEAMQRIFDYYLGNISLMNNDYDTALERFNDDYTLCTEFCIFYGTNLAWLLIQLGDTEEAIDIMSYGIEYYENFAYSRYPSQLVDRAQLYALSFDYTSAITDMDTAIDYAESADFEATELAHLYAQRGDIIMLIYEWNRALESYDTAIGLAPDYAETYYRRGILLYTMVERENAITDFETYLELDPEGEFAESAQTYIESIQTEIQALGG